MWPRPCEDFCVTRQREECARIACRRRFADRGSTNRTLCHLPPIGPMFGACWPMSILTSRGTSGTARSCCCSRFTGCAVAKSQHCGSNRLTGPGALFHSSAISSEASTAPDLSVGPFRRRGPGPLHRIDLAQMEPRQEAAPLVEPPGQRRAQSLRWRLDPALHQGEQGPAPAVTGSVTIQVYTERQ
jgi:hypothetical protein